MNQLGAAVRAWRSRTGPATVGLPANGPRRVPGLRRGELAMLAGVSVEYVVRIEQGRAPTPSAQVCSALARALRLSDEEQAHLLRLAGHAADPGRVPRLIPESLQRIMDQLSASPLAVHDATWALLAWNPLYAAVFGDPSAYPPDGRHVLIRQFELGTLGRARQTPAERAEFEESLVADLRATTSRYPNDPAVTALVARLQRVPRFRELWALRSVADHHSATKVIEHPDAGDIPLESNVLTTQGSDLRLVVYTPRAGTDARSRLDLLAAIGIQQMTP
ncbi:helix-turn-helix transcriptional regulator [Actinoplanes sp. NPDC000266]